MGKCKAIKGMIRQPIKGVIAAPDLERLDWPDMVCDMEILTATLLMPNKAEHLLASSVSHVLKG